MDARDPRSRHSQRGPEEGNVFGKYRRRAEATRSQETHHQQQLVCAADWAITTGWNDAERRADPQAPMRLHVTVHDVRKRAYDDFTLQIPPAEAAAVLRHRLEHRAHTGPYVHTDAYEAESSL